MTGVETFSDHLYIRFEVSAWAVAPPAHIGGTPPPCSRWALRRLDKDALVAASIVVAWPEIPPAGRDGVNVDEEAAWFRDAMSQVCNAGMPGPGRPHPVAGCAGGRMT